jgi:tellurite methyltransferase
MKNGDAFGGYEDGYAGCDCLWGTEPGSLIKTFIESNPKLEGIDVLDLGCGEGKNAAAFAKSGAKVVAVDCSSRALANGRRAFPDREIEWHQSDAHQYLYNLSRSESFDVVVLYGLLHCLSSSVDIAALVRLSLEKTRVGGYQFVVVFNSGPHDLSAHPNFLPVLLPHTFYLELYAQQDVLFESDSILHETHPHNQIPHFHSLTRMLVRKAR